METALIDSEMEHEDDLEQGHQTEQDHTMTALAGELERMKEDAIKAKLPIERRWIEDERQYWGIRLATEDDESDAQLEPEPIDNKTAEKTELASARIGDMLFPTNDPNWGLQPSPHPTNIDGERIAWQEAKDAVDRTQDLIEDYLNQCQYPKQGRNAIDDSCRLGIGVLKGPVPKMTSRKVVRRHHEEVIDPETGERMLDEWGQPVTQSVVRLDIVQDTSPAVMRVDPWMFFALPCRTMEECTGTFEMHLFKEAKMTTLPAMGMDEDAVRAVMRQGPTHSDHETSLFEERESMLVSDTSDDTDDPEFVVWEYHGAIDPELMRRLGILDPNEEPDPLEMYWGEVWFCQNHILKVELNAILGDERVPYYVVPYRRDHANILNSHGVPRIMRDPQRTIDVTYNSMQHNAKVTAGPQAAIWMQYAEPADGSYIIDGPKTWKVKDARVKSIRDIVEFHTPQSAIPNLLPLYEIALQNADTATQLPMLAHGESADTTNQTASGLQMVMNAQNIVQRKFAHAYDDEVTMPMLTRFYWWLMEFHEDDSIKIEMQVDPRGASYLLVKDKQAQHALMALSLVQSDPELKSEIKTVELYKLAFSSMDLPTDRLWKTDEEKQNQEMTPAEQLQMKIAQAQAEEAEAKAIQAQAEADEAVIKSQLFQQNGGMDPGDRMEYEAKLVDANIREMEVEAKLIIAQMERDGDMAQLASKERISFAELQQQANSAEQDRQMQAMLKQMEQARSERHERAQDYMKGLELRLEQNEQALRAQNLRQGHDTF